MLAMQTKRYTGTQTHWLHYVAHLQQQTFRLFIIYLTVIEQPTNYVGRLITIITYFVAGEISKPCCTSKLNS